MMIFGPNVIAPDDAEAASWIASRLGEFGTVGGLVPHGFDLYLLVRPASLADGSIDDTEQIATVASIAERHTATPDLIWFAIWEGYGWTTGGTFYRVSDHRLPTWLVRARGRVRSRVADRSRHRLIRRGLEQFPIFDLPNRRYHLVQGALRAAATISEPGTGRLQLPDLWWPDDRRLFVATDTDLDWTYIAGSQAFIAEIIGAFPERSEIVNRDPRDNQFM